MSERDVVIEAMARELALASGAFSGIARGFEDAPEFKLIVLTAKERSAACDAAIRLAFPNFLKDNCDPKPGVAS